MKYSSFITEGEVDDLSICYDNLYCIDSKLTYFAKEQVILPSVNKWTNTYTWKPEIKILNDEQEIEIFLQDKKITNIPLATFSDMMWISNIGHALFDCLYPIYLALVKFGYENDPFYVGVNHWENRKEKATEVIKEFSKGDIIEFNDVTGVMHIHHLVAGTGRAGNRVIREDYILYGAKYDAINKYRYRIFETFGVQPDKPVNSPPKVIIVDNKRYEPNEKDAIKKTIEYFLLQHVDIKYVEWQHYPSFKDQMEEMGEVDIYVSGPGNGIMYVPFLKQGAVIINLGWMERTQTNSMRPNLFIKDAPKKEYFFPGFMEQSICACASQASTLYYDRYKYNNLEELPLIQLLNQGLNLLSSNKKPFSNYNIDAQVFLEYCKSVPSPKKVADYLTGIAMFIELLINEHPVAANPNIIDMQLLRKLKDKLGFDRRYEIAMKRRVLILIMSSGILINRRQGIVDSYMKRTKEFSNIDILFYSDDEDFDTNTIKMDVPLEMHYRDNEIKTIGAINLIQKKYHNVYDWFLFVDDDTFINIPLLDKTINSFNEHFIYGRELTGSYGALRYLSGGGGFLIPNTIIDRLFGMMHYHTGFSDVNVGKNIEEQHLSIIHNDLFDSANAYKDNDTNNNQQRINTHITQHYISPVLMQEFDNLITETEMIPEETTLVQLFEQRGFSYYPTDKNIEHSYLPIYDVLFKPYRYKPINILEVGIFKGGSVRLFEDYFMNAKIFGYDIVDQINVPLGNRTTTTIKNLNQIETNEFANSPLTIAIDDGSHNLDDQLLFIKLIYPQLLNGGMLIIEDIQQIEYRKPFFDELHLNYELIDLRHIKNRPDDVLLIFRK